MSWTSPNERLGRIYLMSDQPQPNPSNGARVFLEGDIICEVYAGDQTKETVAEINAATDELVAELRSKQKPVLILSDFTNIGEQTQDARDEVKKVLGTRYFDRVAAFGVPARLQVVGRLLLTLTGTSDRVKFFDTRTEAEGWLRSFVSNS